jgi:hypothetical protein
MAAMALLLVSLPAVAAQRQVVIEDFANAG